MSDTILDILGQEIVPGCVVIYGSLSGRSAGLQIGKVTKTKVMQKTNHYTNVEHTEYKITVQGVGLSRESTLQYPNRMVVVPLANVPNDVKEKLGIAL